MERERARDRLERFVLRARRVNAHSLVRDHLKLLQAVADGSFKIRTVKNTETGEYEQRLLIELPPEEAFESLAARLRPFTMRDEPVYWELVLDALEGLTSQETRDEIIDIEQLRAAFSAVTEGRKTPQAYSVITEAGNLTDKELAHDWLNSDALHAKAIKSAAGSGLDLNRRYQAAAGVYTRLGAAMDATYNVIAYLVTEGLLDLDTEVFSKRVIAETSIDVKLVGGYSAPVGSTPMPTNLVDPTDLDPAWTPIHEDFEQIIQSEQAAAKCDEVRGTRGVQIRWPDGTVTTARWVYQVG